VPQETFLFHDTVRSNLLWAKQDATEAELWAALGLAAAQAFVIALPQGLDTVVGDRGIRLSGGERQRLALARALLRKPTLLLLDEATSSLDTENEQRIQDAIEGLHGELTMVVIAHRLSTIRRADSIVVLDRGQVVEAGPWELLAQKQGGRFRGLLEQQN
jgi:ATP-binding cassette, subfamily C, bacterial